MICDGAYRIDIRAYGRNPPRGEFHYRGWSVEVVSTQCNFGGKRWWFLCPQCARRCAILYPRLCRICSGGRYRVELQSPHDRLITKAIRLRRRLGQTEGGTLAPLPQKPKHMHWDTYAKRIAEIREIEARIWSNEAEWLRARRGR